MTHIKGGKKNLLCNSRVIISKMLTSKTLSFPIVENYPVL